MMLLTKNFAQTLNLTDALSDVLMAVRLSGGYVEAFQAGRESEQRFKGKERSILIVQRGRLHFQCKDAGPDSSELLAGDVVLLAYGSDFSVSYPAITSNACEWIRGTFYLDDRLSGFLLSCIPRAIILKQVEHDAMDWLETASRFVMSEIKMREPGGTVMISRIVELLLIRILRLWAQEQATQSSWLLGAMDPAIGTALSIMHTAPDKAWSVPQLAKEIGLSRSVFAARFTALIGKPPLRYLTGLRLDKSAELIKRTNRTISQIAEETGYSSEAAFSRAFKLRFGASPSHWRQQSNIPES